MFSRRYFSMRTLLLMFVALGALSVAYIWTLNKRFTRGNLIVLLDQELREYSTYHSNRSASSAKFHVVFSTGCNAFQDWQSYSFFYSILTSGQTGNVTRVASGCSHDQGPLLRKIFKEQIESLSDRFHLHLTPEYSESVPGKKYKFFNKPMGLRHWFDEGLRYQENRADYKDVIFVLCDPDQLVMRPFLVDYDNKDEVFHPKQRIHTAVSHGKPMAQLYGYGAAFMRQVNMKEVLGNSAERAAQSPASNWSPGDVNNHYTVGPPYIATGQDMYRIVQTWADFVVPVYLQTRDHLSEMFAYSVASLHLNLPHQLMYSLMVSNAEFNPEAWPLVDDMKDPCTQELSKTRVPHVIHFCQRYGLGPWFFSKYALPNNFLSCHHPLMLLPNQSEASTMQKDYNYSYTVPRGVKFQLVNPALHGKRYAFMLCQITRKLNEAATYWKQHHCNVSKDELPNYKQAIVWPHLMRNEVWKTLRMPSVAV